MSQENKVDKTKLVLTIIIPSIILPIVVILVGTDNIWNTPDLDVQLIPNSNNKVPVDDIVRTIFNDPNYERLTADFVRKRDSQSLSSLKESLSPNDAWIVDRIYFTNSTGVSQKIIIKNIGNTQAHDIIIQILGSSNFKIIDYKCPEIMSPDQISKEHGKKYVIVTSRLSVQLECEITINSVGDNGVNEIIVTADDSHPAVWPKDLIDHYRNTAILLTIFGFIAIGILVIAISYNIALFYKKRQQSMKKSPIL